MSHLFPIQIDGATIKSYGFPTIAYSHTETGMLKDSGSQIGGRDIQVGCQSLMGNLGVIKK